MKSGFRTFTLMLILTLIVVWVGGILGGRTGTIIALGFAAAMNFYSYWFSDKMVLRRYKAGEVGPGHPCRRFILPRKQLQMPLLPAEIHNIPLWLLLKE